MTAERLLILDLTDLRALRLACRHCHTVVALPLTEPFTLPEVCPSCKEVWSQDRQSPLEIFVRHLKTLIRQHADLAYDLRFELSDPRP
jgi:hypothetical protein